MEIKIIERHARPTNYHFEPQGTIYKVLNQPIEHYIQVSDDIDKAQWVPISSLLEELFKDLYTNTGFLQELLMVFVDKTRSREELLNHLIKRQ
jgi:hypothetical protein